MDDELLSHEIDKLTTSESERCLQVLVKGFAIRHSYEDLIASKQGLQDVIVRYANLVAAHKQKEVPRTPLPAPGGASEGRPGAIDPERIKEDPEKQAAGVRFVLHAIADDEELRPALEAWFERGRPTLVDPIAAALVLAGIVFILSVDVRVKVTTAKDGKLHVDAELKKEPTKESILKKFFHLFA